MTDSRTIRNSIESIQKWKKINIVRKWKRCCDDRFKRLGRSLSGNNRNRCDENTVFNRIFTIKTNTYFLNANFIIIGTPNYLPGKHAFSRWLLYTEKTDVPLGIEQNRLRTFLRMVRTLQPCMYNTGGRHIALSTMYRVAGFVNILYLNRKKKLN